MKIISEFKEFAMKGSVVDLAVGVVIGGAFGKIVTSLVNDVVMPPIGLLMGGVDFADKKFLLKAAAGSNPAITLNYGNFINATVDFLIVAAAIFFVIKQMNRFKKPAPLAAPTTKECPMCKETIPVSAVRCGHCTSPLV